MNNQTDLLNFKSTFSISRFFLEQTLKRTHWCAIRFGTYLLKNINISMKSWKPVCPVCQTPSWIRLPLKCTVATTWHGHVFMQHWFRLVVYYVTTMRPAPDTCSCISAYSYTLYADGRYKRCNQTKPLRWVQVLFWGHFWITLGRKKAAAGEHFYWPLYWRTWL